MTISKRLREEAADLLQLVASNLGTEVRICTLNQFVDASDDAVRLANLAYYSDEVPGIIWPLCYADAEALLRTGWTP